MVTDEELFGRLLALDHSREPPWGPLHGIVVACHRLQTRTDPVRLDDLTVEQLCVYVRDGQAAVARLWAAAVARNSHRADGGPFREPTGPLLAGPPSGFAVTIADVALDGTFPADGHAERVHAWAVATLAGWGVPDLP